MPLFNTESSSGGNSVGAGNNLIGEVRVQDGVTGAYATVAQFHNGDNQSPGGTANGILTGGVAQLLNAANNLDRQRETGTDNIPAVGIATGTQQLLSPIATTLAAAVAAGATTATLAGTKFTNRGAAAWVQAGSVLFLEPGTANQEAVVVLTVNYATNAITIAGVGTGGNNTGFRLAHANGVAVVTGAYNQAKDATTPDGSTGAGLPAGATYLLNGTLNGGAGGWEGERSAAGEQDGASGAGTAVAAEYEYNGQTYDRARSLQGKGLNSTTLAAAANVGDVAVNLASIAGLQPGAPIHLTGGTAERVLVSQSWNGVANPVPIQGTVANAHANASAALFEVFNLNGPGLNGFLPTGIGIEEEALYDPVSNLFYLERAATADAMPPQNVVAESGALWNGTGFDRMRAVSGDAMGTTGIEASADLLFNGTTYDRPRAVIGDAQPATGLPAEVPMLWNGTNYDRARGTLGHELIAQGASSSLNLSAATVVKAAAGRSVRVNVIVAGTAAGTVNDCATTAAAAANNQTFSIPNTVGSYLIDWPHATGIVVVPGTGQTVAVSYV